MGGRRAKDRKIVMRYTGEVTAEAIGIKIIKLLLEDRERGIVRDACTGKKLHRDLCEGKQG